MADRYFDDDHVKPTFEAKATSTSSLPTGKRLTSLPFCGEQSCFCNIVRDLLERDLKRSVPQYSEDKGPTVILESRYGEPGELQCMAALVGALGMPLRHAVQQMFCDSQCGHIRVTICSSSIFVAKIIAGHLDHALDAYVAHHGLPGHAGLSVAYGDEHLASV
jgi:hypothetical protein